MSIRNNASNKPIPSIDRLYTVSKYMKSFSVFSQLEKMTLAFIVGSSVTIHYRCQKGEA